MKVIARQRQTGKTTELIKRSAEYGFPIVCMNVVTADGLCKKATELGLVIPKPLTYFSVTHGKESRFPSSVLIDDAEMFMQYVCNYRIDTVAITLEAEESK